MEQELLAQRPARMPAPSSPTTPAQRLTLRLRSMTWLATDIVGLELVADDAAALPPFTPGAHVDLHLPGGLIRQYSLYGDPHDRQRYRVAVLRDRKGRGGSEAVHTQLRVGQALEVTVPRNHFELAEGGRCHRFFAGGIGITPILAMVREVQRRGLDWHLTYCTREPGRTAFADELAAGLRDGHVTLHHDHGDPSRSLDLATLLRTPEDDTHLYACGPAGFLDAFERAAAHWPPAHRHLERFGAATPAATAAQALPDQAFEVELARSGVQVPVPAGQSIVQALQARGVEVDTSCCEGYCGTCMTRYLGGEPIHRDSVLDEDDRREFVMVCCARARPEAGPLRLDL